MRVVDIDVLFYDKLQEMPVCCSCESMCVGVGVHVNVHAF